VSFLNLECQLFQNFPIGEKQMNPAKPTRFEPCLLSNPADMDPESAAEYVRSFLGKRFRVVLFDDNRLIVGTVVALDALGTLFLKQCVVRTPKGETRFTTVLVRAVYIQHIELDV
jgi:small nuclear ribonucleoprotein (snRNP)-like protein